MQVQGQVWGVSLGSHCGGTQGRGVRLGVGFHSALITPLRRVPVLGRGPRNAPETALHPGFIAAGLGQSHFLKWSSRKPVKSECRC